MMPNINQKKYSVCWLCGSKLTNEWMHNSNKRLSNTFECSSYDCFVRNNCNFYITTNGDYCNIETIMLESLSNTLYKYVSINFEDNIISRLTQVGGNPSKLIEFSVNPNKITKRKLLKLFSDDLDIFE